VIFGGVMIFVPVLLSELAIMEQRPILPFLSEFTLQLALIEAVGTMALFTFLAVRKRTRLSNEWVQFRFTKADPESVRKAIRGVLEALHVPCSETANEAAKGDAQFAIRDGEYQMRVARAATSGAVIVQGRPKGSQHFFSPEVESAIDVSLSQLDVASKIRGRWPRIPT
jgi:hypothetical protein